jgi:hypothetical protein
VRSHRRGPRRKHHTVYGPLLSNGCCIFAYLAVVASNSSASHTASSLRLFVPNSLQSYCHFFFSEGCACDACDRPGLPSLWLGFHGDYSPTAPTANFLRPLVPSDSLIRCQSVQVYHQYPSFPFGWGPSPPQCPVIHFLQPDAKLDCSLFDLQLYGLHGDPARCLLLPHIPDCCG